MFCHFSWFRLPFSRVLMFRIFFITSFCFEPKKTCSTRCQVHAAAKFGARQEWLEDDVSSEQWPVHPGVFWCVERMKYCFEVNFRDYITRYEIKIRHATNQEVHLMSGFCIHCSGRSKKMARKITILGLFWEFATSGKPFETERKRKDFFRFGCFFFQRLTIQTLVWSMSQSRKLTVGASSMTSIQGNPSKWPEIHG